jgi:hypothetical protein
MEEIRNYLKHIGINNNFQDSLLKDIKKGINLPYILDDEEYNNIVALIKKEDRENKLKKLLK